MTNEASESARNQRVGQAIAEYLDAIDQRSPLPVDKWLDSYADVKDQLHSFLRGQSHVAGLVGNLPLDDRGVAVAHVTTDAGGDSAEIFPDGPGPFTPRNAGYEILDELGRGGMGVVYRARQTSLDREVALKVPLGVNLNADDLRRFRLEADAVAQLDHPGIIPTYEVGGSERQPFLSMKLLTGGNLSGGTQMEPRKAASIMVQIADAIEHAHQRGILHRDLKPSNIMLDGTGQPVVTDFGLAKHLHRDPLAGQETTAGTMLGTPAYMAPEQIVGQATTLSDVYSLGAILYALLTGKAPFNGTSPIEVVGKVRNEDPVAPGKLDHSVPKDLETICLKCLSKDPKRRYASAKEFGRDLNAWLNHLPILAKPASAIDRLTLWTRRNPALAISVFVTTAALLIAVSAMGWMLIRAERDNRQLQAERSLAVENLHLAEQAIDELLSEVQDELVQFPAIDPVRNRMLQRALDLQRKIMIRNDAQAVSQKEQPMARIRMAELYWELGQVTEASQELEKVQATIGTFREVVRYASELESDLALRCRTSILQAEIHQHHQRFREAEDTLTSLVELREKEQDKVWALKHEFAYLAARRQRAILIAKHSQDESLAEFEQVLRETEAIQERAKTGEPDEQRQARELLANAANSYGIALYADGRTDAAIKSYQRTVTILQEMGQGEPLNHRQKSSLARTLMNLGNRLTQQNLYKDAAQSYLDSKILYEQLINENPGRASNKADAIGTLIGLGIASYRSNRLEQALELYQEAEDLLDKYGLEHPELQGSWDRNRSTVLVNLVNCYTESSQFEKAHEVADRVIAMRRLANSADPDGGRGAKVLAVALGNKAAIFERQDQSENALPVLKEAIELYETALGYAPRNAEFLRSYELDVRRLLQIYLRESDFEALRVALEQFRRLTESEPRLLAQLLEFTNSQDDAKSEEVQAVLSKFR